VLVSGRSVIGAAGRHYEVDVAIKDIGI
jgi:hypothetical protein